MRYLFASSISIAALLIAFTVHAENDSSITIPDKVRSNILKRHPQAQDMHASYETHFGQKLLEVSYKDATDEEILELFTTYNHLFTNELKIDNLGGISTAALSTLKETFPNYTLQKAELIVNPNGAGEEYEIYLRANGDNWKISINDRGTTLDKQQLKL